MQPNIKAFFHEPSFTLTYVISDPKSNYCAIIDPALDFDIFSGSVTTEFADQIIDFVRKNNMQLVWLLETHAHADHISSAAYIQSQLGGKIAIGADITNVQKRFKKVFNLDSQFATSGQQFDVLLNEGDAITLGELEVNILATPGHTPDSVSYLIGDNLFIGDTLFMPDSGSARCDFPGGDAAQLYQSIQKIYALGDDIKLYMCHDYQPNGRALEYLTTVAEQKDNNIHLNSAISEADYISIRTQRDANLANPKMLYPALRFNIQAGHLPEPEDNKQRYVKIPLITTPSYQK